MKTAVRLSRTGKRKGVVTKSIHYNLRRLRTGTGKKTPGEPGQTHGIAYRYISIKQPIHMDNHIVQCTFVQCVMTGKKAAGA